MPEIMIAILLLGAPTVLSIYSTLCVFYPKIRGKWRGSDRTIGTMSSIGAALFFDAGAFIVWGLVFLPMRVMNRLAPIIFATILIGFILVVLGSVRDLSPK
ncbi:hypothetical protein BST81_26270 [Leptolyngbya sp. 'hensonii']|nr:hypothetical protein BST81_26270 [Leptolyngbya sp. 'hensonii']